MDDLDEFDGDDFTEQERRKMRQIIRDRERHRWLWSQVKLWGFYGSISVSAIYAGWDVIVRIIRAGLGR